MPDWLRTIGRLVAIWALGCSATFYTIGSDNVTSDDRWIIAAGGLGFVAATGVAVAVMALLRRRRT